MKVNDCDNSGETDISPWPYSTQIFYVCRTVSRPGIPPTMRAKIYWAGELSGGKYVRRNVLQPAGVNILHFSFIDWLFIKQDYF